jgi:hypothetical protein
MTSPPKVQAKYQKDEVLKQLKDSESAVLASLKTYEEDLAHWKETAPQKLAARIAEYEANGYFGSRDFDFPPPKLNPACQDWRIQNLNKAILRITAMTPDEKTGSINLRGDDPLWEYVALAACL